MYTTDRAAVLLVGADAFLLNGSPTSDLLDAVVYCWSYNCRLHHCSHNHRPGTKDIPHAQTRAPSRGEKPVWYFPALDQGKQTGESP